MSKNILDKKIPSLAGLGVLAVGLVATTLLVKGPNSFITRANPESNPENIQITNISDSSFTVVYTTEDKVIGTLTYGENAENLDKVNLDERDQLTQTVSKYQTHSITVNNLKPETNYFFTITSSNKSYNNNGEPYNVKTGPLITGNPSDQIPMAGKVLNPEGKTISDGLVVVNINGAQKISGIFRENGNYTIPLNNLRTSDLSKYYLLDETSKINVFVTSDNLNSIANLTKNQISPVPIITLSNTYDFSNNIRVKSNTARAGEVEFPEFNSEKSEPSISKNPRPTKSL